MKLGDIVKRPNLLFFLVTILCLSSDFAFSQSDIDYFYLPKDQNLTKLSNIDKTYTPASVVKLLTASHALFTLGGNFQFTTKIFLTPKGELVVVGVGDPSLTSDNLRLCLSQAVNKIGKKGIDRLLIDNTAYSSDIDVPGRGGSRNPYDAEIGAISINYNSIALRVLKSKGSNVIIESGEAETPLTDFAKKEAHGLKKGNHRVSIRGKGGSERQFTELAMIFLKDLGVNVKDGYLIKPKPEDAKLITECQSDNLEEILKSMLKYSNNFSANQIFLNSGARYYGFPAGLKKSKQSINKFLLEEVGFEGDFNIDDGAGLSPTNKLTARQLLQILQYFEPSKDLLPQSDGVFYKSGTLSGVSNLAGYYFVDGKVDGYFALFGRKPRTIPDRVSLVKKLTIK